MKKTIGLISIVAIAMALTLTIAFSGVALASPAVPSTSETEKLEIITTITCNGDVVESQSLNWEIDSGNLLDNSAKGLAPKEKYGKIGYNEKMIGSSGTIEFDKCFDVDTGTAPNLDVHKQIGYTAGFLGSLSHEEQLGMKIIAAGKGSSKKSCTQKGSTNHSEWKQDVCPFKYPCKDKDAVPGSCEEVNIYSKIVMTDVQAETDTEVGITDAPVNLHYKINAVGTGLVIAGVSAYVADGRGADSLGSRMTYKEKSIGYGENVEFTKDIGYKSVISP